MRLCCNKDLSIRKIDNELFIYNREKALIHTFNRTGVVLWEAIFEGLSFDAMIDRITETFEIDRKQAANDANEFITTLRSFSLVE